MARAVANPRHMLASSLSKTLAVQSRGPALLPGWCCHSIPRQFFNPAQFGVRRTLGDAGRLIRRRAPVLSPTQRWCRTLRQTLRPRLHIIAQLPHDLGGPADIRFAESDAEGRGDHQELGVELAVACIAFGRQLHELRALVLRIVDEFDEPLGRKLIRQPLHALATGGSHPGDLRHGERTKQREASHETERTAAPTGDEPRLLAKSPYFEEALGHFEHQLPDRLGLAVNDWACRRPSAHPGPVSYRRHPRSLRLYQFLPVDTVVVKR